MVSKFSSTISLFFWHRGEKYHFFVWNETLQKIFIVLLVLNVITLSLLAYLQYKIIVG